MFASLPDAGFDRVAAFYDPLSRLVYGPALLRAQQHALATGLPPGAPHLLVIGGGTGAVLLEILRLRPQATIVYLEASPQMLAKAQALLHRQYPTATQQVVFQLGTEKVLTEPEVFDGIITFFFLDLFDPQRLRQVVTQLNATRRPMAPWLLADFAPPQRWWQRALLMAMYHFFRFTTGISGRDMPPIQAELARLGLQVTNQQSFFRGMVQASVWVP
ncbi:class I SAM-dependent methyltransferase [Hymenobacter volaticus]|uniref:Class I SAM-dependent methyltransferase n=1 Tax=Hymenobacter volaticus TaxID=2932254 RepID=A0ABY4G8Z2_9BACT|nr:class I SAM-dependent methyltransferase [Hymenobacter volaticus]UOQ67379.1 class I SAM-dependent methyltransferase [Hymenobacter volaticus]